MKFFSKNKNVIVNSEVQQLALPDSKASGNHVFALHSEAIFTINETDDGVKIGGVLFTREQAIRQLESVASGLLYIASQLK
jgi:hypothetical protein